MKEETFEHLYALKLLSPGAIGDILELSQTSGASIKALLEVAAKFAKQGISEYEVARRTKDAIVLSRLSGNSLRESVELLTVAVGSFKKEGSFFVNKLSKVDDKTSLSLKELSESLIRCASAANDVGLTFDNLISIISSIQKKTAHRGEVIGNALKSIFVRLESSRKDIAYQLGGVYNAAIADALIGILLEKSGESVAEPLENMTLNITEEASKNLNGYSSDIEKLQKLEEKFYQLLNSQLDQTSKLRENGASPTEAELEYLRLLSDNYSQLHKQKNKVRCDYNGYLAELERKSEKKD